MTVIHIRHYALATADLRALVQRAEAAEDMLRSYACDGRPTVSLTVAPWRVEAADTIAALRREVVRLNRPFDDPSVVVGQEDAA